MWLFNWLCLIISELTQLVSVCWWSPNLLLSSFSKGLILKWPNRRLIVGDLWPSVITYDMLCPHLTPYKAILTIDSLLLLHHQIISQTYPILFDDSRYRAKVFFLALTEDLKNAKQLIVAQRQKRQRKWQDVVVWKGSIWMSSPDTNSGSPDDSRTRSYNPWNLYNGADL